MSATAVPQNEPRPATTRIRAYAEDIDVVALGGEHDLKTALLVRETIARAAAELVLVDLTECDFLDSTVLKTLALAHKETHGAGRRMELVVAGDRRVVTGLLQMSGLAAVIPVRASIEEAARPA